MKTKPLLEQIKASWKKFLSIDAQESEKELFRKHERTVRPLGSDLFVENLEKQLGCRLKPKKPGPKTKDK